MCVCLCLSVASCGKADFEDAQIVFTTSESVSTFDPQFCSTPAENTIVTNAFEGLMTKNEKGEIVCGSAESYTVSNNKKVYTFVVRDGLMWSDGETSVTANDFLFGILRALKPETKNKHASSLFIIKNAEEYNKGNLDEKNLGLKVQGNSLTITLTEPNDGLLEVLTKPICMPCNEEFFNSTGGRYGLSNKYIISNGAYSIDYYNTDTKTVVIQNNENYKGEYNGVARSVTVNYGEEYKDIFTAFETQGTDIANIECSYLKSLQEKEITTDLFYNETYCLYFSKTLVTDNGGDLKRALVNCINTETIKNNINDYYSTVGGIIPDINILNGKNYRDAVGSVTLPKYDVEKAQELLGNFDEATKKLNGLAIYYPENDRRLSLISNLIAQGWQKDLNVFINSKSDTVENIKEKVKRGEVLIAMIPVSCENNDAIGSFNSLSELKITSNANGVNEKELLAREQSLINNGVVYPVLGLPIVVSYTKNIAKLNVSKDGKVLDFRFVEKS